MRITPGHFDEYCDAIQNAVTFAREHAPQMMVDVFVAEDRQTATSFQIYPDSEAVLEHWRLSDPYIAEVMMHCTVEKFEVFGSPSDDVREGFGQMSGISASINPRLIGYMKTDAHAG